MYKRQEESALVVGHVGRFNGQKNHRFLLEVFSRLLKARPDARLLLVGDGYLEAEVRQQAAPLGERVMFTGSVPDPETYLAAMDVMALPSLFEGFPTVLLEWQCAGLPTLASASAVSYTHLPSARGGCRGGRCRPRRRCRGRGRTGS